MQREAGCSLVEVVVATVLLAGGVVGLAGSARAALRLTALGNALASASDSTRSTASRLRSSCPEVTPYKAPTTTSLDVSIVPDGAHLSAPLTWRFTLLCP
ncbi:MAG TPA: hypothetical protein VNL98_13640 [Gemmatimonadales bacterium]|nr:hypothetical protein [Gemmatimonadales bacterium]